jgi:hypothetical protein
MRTIDSSLKPFPADAGARISALERPGSTEAFPPPESVQTVQ